MAGYALLRAGEDVAEASKPSRASRIQWLCIAILTIVAGVLLTLRLVKPREMGYTSVVSTLPVNSTAARYRRRRYRYGTGMASFYHGVPPRRIKGQAAKAATRTVVLIGSHFDLGNQLLKRVFGELCQRPRLSLRCESSWGGPHDLKSLASVKGGKRRRIVWLESDAGRLRSAVRAVRTHASDFRLVHLLWDPVQACAAQWPQLAPNASLGHLCDALHLELLPALYKRAKRDSRRGLTLRLEDLVRRKSNSPGLTAAWRQLFKFLELPEKAADLTTIASRAISDLRLREHIYNRDAPSWVRGAIERNSTLTGKLRRLRSELEYPGGFFAM